MPPFGHFDIRDVETPCYVVCRELLEQNLQILRATADAAGCKILLAQKAFSMFRFYPLIARYLDGSTASGLFEARLGQEEMGGQNHIFSPAYRENEFPEILRLCDHIVFNSFAQWEKFRPAALAANRSCGLRVNPKCSTQEHGAYDPCSPGSRLGVTPEVFRPDLLEGLEGLHFHTLCEQDSDALEITLDAVERHFGQFLSRMKWLNMGGGHHITRNGYDVDRLVRLIERVRWRYGVEVYLEPGEAVALNSGFLVAEVVDIVENAGIVNAILDASAACHMPDILEMPYRAPLFNSGAPGEKSFTYRLGGPTCLSGDIIGDYSFDEPLRPGYRLVFGDMAIYSMVKNNTFNGMRLPSVYASENGALELVRAFGYEDFKARL
jgi:carboxynorspermidine decarboxylase